MKLFKKLGTYISMLTLVLTGTSFKSIASEGEEDAEAFDDPNTSEEEDSGAEAAAAATGTAASAGTGAGVWVAITGAVLALFSGSDGEYTTPSGDEPVTPTPTPSPSDTS